MKNKLGIFGAGFLMALGIFWFWLVFFELPKEDTKIGIGVLVIYGLISIVLGVYILFNLKKEDTIEQIKKIKGKRR